MDGRPTWTDCDEAGDYAVPNVLSPRDLVFRPDNMDETVPHTNPKFQAASHLLWFYSPVCVGPGWKSQRPVFSQRASFICD